MLGETLADKVQPPIRLAIRVVVAGRRAPDDLFAVSAVPLKVRLGHGNFPTAIPVSHFSPRLHRQKALSSGGVL